MEPSQRIFYALLAVASLAFIGWAGSQGGGEGLAFGLFSVLILGGGLVCIWERSVVRSAFSLMATFGGVAGLFLLLGSDFLAMMQILIYVGGILVLILFGVMLSPPDLMERKISRVLGGLAFMGLGVAWVGAKVAGTVKWATADQLPPMTSRAADIGVAFVSPDGYVVAFELAAVVLTVALVAAVYIARRRLADVQPRSEAGEA
jgi:NADH-quinone oxidoreductase subunit J